jgi:hypothetical protein
MDQHDGVPIECATFFVGRQPQVMWGTDLREKNLEFLRGIDAGYFEHVALTHGPLLDSENKHYAAAAIRIAHGQALETLMGLIAAALQATTCPLGWMLAYQNRHLKDAIIDISGSIPDRSHLVPLAVGRPLDLLAEEMLAATPWPKKTQESRAKAFARCWERWCGEFLDDYQTAEYNALKHGNRTQLGGFMLAIGQEAEYGQPADPTSMHTLVNSEFGSSFFVLEKIHTRLHQRPKRIARNWSPTGMGHALILMSMSIGNIASFLRRMNGDDPESCRYTAPGDDDAFDLPWQGVPGVSMMTGFDYRIEAEDIEKWSADEVREDILSRYQAAVPDEQKTPID